ncbi:hypothetical protein K502DRAFT_345816 [Neoconidiobolus thromboides FSU 785]|nr:hypothetical protein K502DRAFT_345816 [Neoconidiobolus thromboides FSU 785]
MSTEEYIYTHGICVKELFHDIQYLKVIRSYSYFATLIIPYLSFTITTLIFNNTPNDDHTYYFKLPYELENLRRLELNYFTMELDNLNFFSNKQYLQLNHLVINNIEVKGSKVVNINLSNYPKLESLTIRGRFMVVFNGRSNLKMLSLDYCDLTKATINNDIFPKINQFLFTSGNHILSRHLYSIFNMSIITYLEFSRSQLTFLIKEIYPKKINNMRMYFCI